MKMAITSCALWAFTGNSVGCCTFAWLRTFWTHRYCYHCQPQQASSIEAATSLIDCETPMEVCNTELHRERMLADTLTKGAGWINGDASCRSDELKSPDTQTFQLISFIPGPRRWHSGAEVLFRYVRCSQRYLWKDCKTESYIVRWSHFCNYIESTV